MYLMSYFAEKVAWCVVIVIQIGLIGITISAFSMNSSSIDAVEKTRKDTKQTTTSIKAYADEQASYQGWLIFTGVIFGIISLLFLTCLIKFKD